VFSSSWFFWLQRVTLIGPSQKKKPETLEAAQNLKKFVVGG
jgi:hypothetical protein